MARWTKQDITITTEDGSAAYTATISGVGDFSIDGIAADNREALPVYERDSFVGLVPGQDKQQAWSCTINLPNSSLTHASAERVLDLVRKTGSYSSATTTDPGGREYAVKVIVALSDGSNTGTLTLPNSRVEASIDESGEVLAVSLSGVNYSAPTYA